MKQRITANLLSFVVVLVTAIGTGTLAMRFPRAEDAHSGPGSFPLFLAVLLAGLSVSGIFLSLREGCPPDSYSHPEDGPPMGSTTEPLARCSLRTNMFLLTGAAALYLLALPLLGFISATALLCAGVLMVLGYRNPVRALAAGFITAFTLYGIFGLLMNVVLPKGWIG